jgi:uncharacterized lipoprotein YehR (DUF1307 family)
LTEWIQPWERRLENGSPKRNLLVLSPTTANNRLKFNNLITADAKKDAEKMISAIKSAFILKLPSVTWLDESTREMAIKKVKIQHHSTL